ncbi:equilibrative nucleobase transporter 1-like [Narcine bancroftii]|uniref:equilibrative nucleobase transporter 1-like n=1 Tax=Narcine bancroftii TaxID=1343680 RepID=UPI003831EFD8
MPLRLFLFIGTLNPMLNLLANGDPRQVSRFTNTFAISQLFAIFFSPFSGLILDRHKRKGCQLNSAADEYHVLGADDVAICPSTQRLLLVQKGENQQTCLT